MNEVQPGPAFAYDEVAYPTPVLPIQTPDRLAAIGMLHGWRPAAPETASVLEIGCGDGLNLSAVAAVAPRSHCVGFDLSGAAIARGRALAGAAGLTNIDLHQGDILDYPRDGAPFDYIVSHGVYSWIPQPVRLALLELVGRRLAPGGVAYVSFDALPAASPKAFINAFLMRELRDVHGIEARYREAVRLLAMLARNQRPESRLKVQLDQLLDDLPGFDPAYFFHDWLAEHYAPVTLDDFGALAEANGLLRAGDAGMYDMFTGDLDEEASAMIEACGTDMVRRSNLMHMLRGAHLFRRELLVRADAPPPAIGWDEAVQTLSFSYKGSREAIEDEDGPGLRYTDGPSSYAVARDPVMLDVMDQLFSAMPNERTFAQLLDATGRQPGELADMLRRLSTLTIIDAHAMAQNFLTEPGELPRAGSLIRAMMFEGETAISLRHGKIRDSMEASRTLIALCDGTRSRDELARQMSGVLDMPVDRAKIDAAIAYFAAHRVFEA